MPTERAFVVGGTFDRNGGRESSIVQALHSGLEKASGQRISILNGGSLESLRALDLAGLSLLLWFPNIDNAEDKILPSIKEKNPRLFLVSSKRVVEKDYTESDVVGRLLKTKSNLGWMIERPNDRYHFKVLDPLGNIWADTSSIHEVATRLWGRIQALRHLTRIASESCGPVREFKIEPAFVDAVRILGSKFSKFVNAVNPNRLLGNAATRCSYGFPSIRQEQERIFVTRRNVDKVSLSEADFVEVEPSFDDNGSLRKVRYFGEVKPSVDTPIQILLFRKFKSPRYIVHGHVYVDSAPMTLSKLPCGSVEEVEEVASLAAHGERNFAVNLRGHGCLLFATDLEYLRSALFRGRPFPEGA